MKDLIIVGASNAARDVLQVVKEINKVKATWNIKGFVADSGLDIHTLTNGDFHIMGSIDQWTPKPGEEYVCAIADPNAKRIVTQRLGDKGAKFANIIHPNVEINDYCSLGEGVILYRDAVIGPNAVLGNHVHVNTKIAHDCRIGDYTTVSILAAILGYVTIGSGVFVSAGSTIIPHIAIGDNAYIGAGSVVITNVAGNTKVFGNPARETR
ncbi:NeuD/PglB/VioB family sugar acetyltransferase [Desulfosporosinus meridiei]|uniref:Sugar O-acyltransferase, sialic acid O-acetyltransferase NeuD family n=1 Tax=Desulfosporosinus meridiei (strain ATCC BAA-275 / DSM 13257 / KCTC 12902 / NCIMB 13706 / S10) TaxID=768704 RepID=J7J3U0_DESMD|nr:NeuD/PglB/VioB family sugar acetyltransferase [Desulfosporosinus meridiei]AFQ45938.1 sugar O-acyltransferase, sialic acid O-acetyltransferase NeuD family [Desulfosporosinus meridiei DSM 13257]